MKPTEVSLFWTSQESNAKTPVAVDLEPPQPAKRRRVDPNDVVDNVDDDLPSGTAHERQRQRINDDDEELPEQI